MNNQSFSKIWVIVILVVVIAGGIFVWQYFRAPEEGIKIEKELVEKTIDKFMDYRTKAQSELYSFLPDNVETINLKYVTVLTSFSNIVLTAPDLKKYEVVKGKEIAPDKIQFAVKSQLVGEEKDLGYYNEDIIMEKVNDKYLITSFKQGEYNSIVEDPCQDLEGEAKDVCYYRLAEETKNSEFCGEISPEWGIAVEGAGRGECYAAVGVLLSDTSLCEKGELREKWCYGAIAVKEKKEEFCEKADNKSLCYYYLALRKNDPTLCEFAEDIPGQYEEEACGPPAHEGFGFLYRSACELYFTETVDKPPIGISGKKFIQVTGLEPNQETSLPFKFKLWGFYLGSYPETNQPIPLELLVKIKDGTGQEIYGLWSYKTTAGCSTVNIWKYNLLPATKKGIIEISDSEEKLLEIPIIFGETKIIEEEAQIIVKQSSGAGLLIAECANESYITETADYIIEGTVEKVEVLKRAVSGELEGEIFTYSDILIGRYLKGIPFDSNKLRIETPGGCTEEICLEVEDQPIFHKGTKVRIYLQKTNGEFSIVCGQFGVTEVGEKGVGEECPIGKIYINDRCVWNFISSDNPLDYLGDRVAMTRESDWKDYQPLVKKVQELIKNKTTDREKAIAIAEWVVNSRPYGVSEPFKTVIETFNAEAGGCEEAAVLTTAMLRIADIPARVLYSGHFWTDAYFDGAWKSIDTTFGIVLRFDFNITDSFVYQYYRFFDKLPYDTQLVNCSIYKHVSRYDQDGENVMFALGFTDGDPYTPDIPIMSYFLLTTEENGQIGELKIQPLDYFPGICIDTNLNELVRYTLPETGLVYMQLPLGKKYKLVYEPLPGPVLAYIEFELKKGSPLQLTPDMLKRGEGVNQTVFEDFKKRLISEWMPGSGIEVKEIEIEH